MKQLIKVKVHTYRLDISIASELEEYQSICKKLKNWGYEAFSAISPKSETYAKRQEFLRSIQGVQEIDTKCLFQDQFNTENGYRIFFWYEPIFDNKDIKEGHYIEYSQELMDAIENQYVCGYCGARYDGKPEHKFCNKCLGSEYLKREDYILLELKPVSQTRNYKYTATQEELNDLQNYIESAQNVEREKSFELTIKKEKERHKKELEKAQLNHDLALYLLEHRILNRDWIYYDHTNTIVFGWNSKIDRDVLENYCEIASNFKHEMNIHFKHEGEKIDWKRGALL